MFKFLPRYLTPLECVQQQNVHAFAVGKKDCSILITAILNLAASARSGAISERCCRLLAQLANMVILPLCPIELACAHQSFRRLGARAKFAFYGLKRPHFTCLLNLITRTCARTHTNIHTNARTRTHAHTRTHSHTCSWMRISANARWKIL